MSSERRAPSRPALLVVLSRFPQQTPILVEMVEIDCETMKSTYLSQRETMEIA